MLAALDKKSTSSGTAQPYACAIKNEGQNRGGEGTRPVIVQKLESRCVDKNKNVKV